MQLFIHSFIQFACFKSLVRQGWGSHGSSARICRVQLVGQRGRVCVTDVLWPTWPTAHPPTSPQTHSTSDPPLVLGPKRCLFAACLSANKLVIFCIKKNKTQIKNFYDIFIFFVFILPPVVQHPDFFDFVPILMYRKYVYVYLCVEKVHKGWYYLYIRTQLCDVSFVLHGPSDGKRLRFVTISVMKNNQQKCRAENWSFSDWFFPCRSEFNVLRIWQMTVGRLGKQLAIRATRLDLLN